MGITRKPRSRWLVSNGHIGIAHEDLQPRPAFVGINQGFTQWIAGQQSSIDHPGEERLYQRLGFGQPDILLLFGAFQSLLANIGSTA